jgi:Tfp pilus assembly protein FimV
VVVVVVAVAVCALLSLVLATASASAGPANVSQRTHVVQPGETLWDIAFELDPSTDTRVVVARLAELNGLASVDVKPGQALLLPSTQGR